MADKESNNNYSDIYVTSDYSKKAFSFFMGMIIGAIIIIVIIFLMILFKWLYYKEIMENVLCRAEDYHVDVVEALNNTANNPSDILYEENGILYYKNVPIRGRNCYPRGDSKTIIEYPQFCKFERNTSGNLNNRIGTGKLTFISDLNQSAEYYVEEWQSTVETGIHCKPKNANEAYYGIPLAKWMI
jgi:hypothetical protein